VVLSIVGWKVAWVVAWLGRVGTFAAALRMADDSFERTQERTEAGGSVGPPQPRVWETLYQSDCAYWGVLGRKLRDVPDMEIRPETRGEVDQAKDQ
jgi:hypothetical protein